MQELLIAAYILKTQQQAAAREVDYAEVHDRANKTVGRALVSLMVSVASLTALVVAIDVFK